jgi:hypothetical protein
MVKFPLLNTIDDDIKYSCTGANPAKNSQPDGVSPAELTHPVGDYQHAKQNDYSDYPGKIGLKNGRKDKNDEQSCQT